MDTAKQPMLAVRIPVEIMNRLDSLAAMTGRTKTFYVREAILEHIDDMEDLYLAEREREEVRAGRSISVPLEDLMKQYGLAD
jgi:RHH-type rel operon transcriptional repressor/antitoxin RelB